MRRWGIPHALGVAAAAVVGLWAHAAHAMGGGSGIGGAVIIFFVAGLQAMFGLVLCEIGVALLLIEKEDRARFFLLLAAAMGALIACAMLPFLAPVFAFAPVVWELWRERREHAIGVAAGALALGGLAYVWSTAAVLTWGLAVALPFLPLSVVLWRGGKKQLALATLASWGAVAGGLYLVWAWSFQKESLVLIGGAHLATGAVLAAPLAYFFRKQGKHQAALAVIAGVPAATLAVDVVFFGGMR